MAFIQYPLGKKAARKNSIKLRFSKYAYFSQLPRPADINNFGHFDLMKDADWGMLGNDLAGDCYFAGSTHETMQLSVMGGNPMAKFTDESVLSDYSALTGYNANDPSTDQGTDMQQGAAYRKNVGLLDANGIRHKVDLYLSLTAGDIDEQMIALYLFGPIGIGLEFTQAAMEQFNAGEPWDYVPGAKVIGGHYVPGLGRQINVNSVSWATPQSMTKAYFENRNDESVAYLSQEALRDKKSLEGFDWEQLSYDFARL